MQIVKRGLVYDGSGDVKTRVACFPGLVRLLDGRILAMSRVGSSKDSADETVAIVQSSDEGNTWKPLPHSLNTSLNGVPGSLRIAHLVETRPGHLLLVASWIDRTDSDAPISNPETAGLLPMHLVLFRSPDGGLSWSEAEDITHCSPFIQPELSGPVIALQEPGHFLIPTENQKHYHDPTPIPEKAYALLSRDYGETWNEWAMIADRTPHFKQWCNRVARYPESGRLICFSWTFDEATQQDLPIHIILGSPDGTQWAAPVSSGVMGQLSTPFPLDEKTLLMGYVHRHQPASIRLLKSFDEGKTWGEELIVFSGAQNAPTDGAGGDLTEYYKLMTDYTFGWNPMVRLKNGNVLMIYFAGMTESMNIHSVEIEL
jgi:hypothetical protein